METKLGIANELALMNRKLIAEQANKSTALECDIEVKEEEVRQLKVEKERLQEKLNDLTLQVANHERSLKMSAQTTDFFEQERSKEVARVQEQFDDFRARVLAE